MILIKLCLVAITLALVVNAISQVVENLWLITPRKYEPEELLNPFTCGFGNSAQIQDNEKEKSPCCSDGEHQGKN